MNQLSENEIDFRLQRIKEKEARGESVSEDDKLYLEIMKMRYEAAHAQSHNKYEIADPLMALLKEHLKDNKFIKSIEHKRANIIINTTISDIILSILISDYYLLDKLKYDEKRLIHEIKICNEDRELVNKIVEKTGLGSDGDYDDDGFSSNGIVYPETGDSNGVIKMIQLILNSADAVVNGKVKEDLKVSQQSKNKQIEQDKQDQIASDKKMIVNEEVELQQQFQDIKIESPQEFHNVKGENELEQQSLKRKTENELERQSLKRKTENELEQQSLKRKTANELEQQSLKRKTENESSQQLKKKGKITSAQKIKRTKCRRARRAKKARATNINL